MMKSHTPTPWYLGMQSTTVFAVAADGINPRICQADGGANNAAIEAKANAAFIVRACNAYDELVAFIESLTELNGAYPYLDGTTVVGDARAILRKARGEA